MNKLTLVLAASGALALAAPVTPAFATIETAEARSAAAEAATAARNDMVDVFGDKQLDPGEYVWNDKAAASGAPRFVISLSDQLAYLYRGDQLVAVTTISSGTASNPTPTGIFPILGKKKVHFSNKYDNAPMPFMQRLDKWGIALHAGHNPGYPASHGCIRLPKKFAAKLFNVTKVGSEVMIAA